MFTLPSLPYSFDALEPYIDAKTMEIHHDKHHKTYVDKLNTALEKYPNLIKKPVDELIKDINKIPEDVRTAVKNHGGGHFNHSFWWLLLKKDVKLKGEIANAINKKFGSYDNFKEEFTKSALGLFGSGWCWLVINGSQLEIVNTLNQDSPLSQGKVPVLGIDLWEHAHYILYYNRRDEYIKNWWNVVNWNQVNDNFSKTKEQ